MRSALISMAGQPRDPARGAPLTLAGKSLLHRQLDFALAAGCEAVMLLGDGTAPEAIALRHVAEAAGARFQVVRDSHGLLGAVRATDELLALAPGLLPEAPEALEAMANGGALLVLPAGQGVAAGFERIDLERAWAGALVVGGAQVERLSDLPPDIEPASALVRIALQARVKERRLPEGVLANGSWAMLAETAGTAALDQAWIARYLPRESALAPSRWLADQVLRRSAGRLLALPRSLDALIGGAAALLVLAVGLAAAGMAALGLAVGALLPAVASAAARLRDLRQAPFARPPARSRLVVWLPGLVDLAILACAVLAIEGSWLHRLFPPLVLLGTLQALRPASALVADRGVIALLLAIAAAVGLAEPAIMAFALGLVALNTSYARLYRG